MVSTMGNPTVLTKEQLARFKMPYQDVIREHWNRIPEVVETTSYKSEENNLFSDITGFFHRVGKFAGDCIANFGFGIQETLTTILMGLILLLFLYLTIKLCVRRNSKKRCKHNDSIPESWKCVPSKDKV